MNRYLTNKSQRKLGVFGISIVVILSLLDIGIITNAINDYEHYRHSWFFLNITHYLQDYYPSISPVIVDLVLVAIITLAIFRILGMDMKKRRARIISEHLMAQRKTQLLLPLLDHELKIRNSEKKITKLVRGKYLQGVSFDEKYMHL